MFTDLHNLPINLDSPARLAATLRLPTSVVLRAADELGLQPTIRLDGRPLYDSAAAEAIVRHVRLHEVKP